MAIPREYETSNKLVRDDLAKRPYETGERAGDFVAPDYPVDAEKVSHVVIADHKLSTDDMRAADALAKEIRFETGSTAEVSVIERAQKSTIDSRKIEEAAERGDLSIVTDRAQMHRGDILDLKEMRIASLVTSPANYASGHKQAGVNLATVDLIGLMDTMQDAIKVNGRRGKATRAVLGTKSWRAIRRNEDFAAFASKNPAQFGTSGSRERSLVALAAFLELDEVRIADFSRTLDSDTAMTDFWPLDSFLLFGTARTLSNHALAQTVVVPYGQYQGAAQGTVVDVRTAKLQGTEEITEIGAYHRYRTYLTNANRGFLLYETLGWA
jgi:hypothetical protein